MGEYYKKETPTPKKMFVDTINYGHTLEYLHEPSPYVCASSSSLFRFLFNFFKYTDRRFLNAAMPAVKVLLFSRSAMAADTFDLAKLYMYEIM